MASAWKMPAASVRPSWSTIRASKRVTLIGADETLTAGVPVCALSAAKAWVRSPLVSGWSPSKPSGSFCINPAFTTWVCCFLSQLARVWALAGAAAVSASAATATLRSLEGITVWDRKRARSL